MAAWTWKTFSIRNIHCFLRTICLNKPQNWLASIFNTNVPHIEKWRGAVHSETEGQVTLNIWINWFHLSHALVV